MDNGLIGSVINALPIGKMISTPLQAMITAQTSAAKSHTDFLLQVCVQNGKAVAVQFNCDEAIVDGKNVAQGMIQKTMCVPPLYAIVHPMIAIEEDTIDFGLEITQSEKSSSTTEAEGSLQAKFSWDPFSISVSGRASHKSEQTHSTDTHAKYSFHTQVRHRNPPGALMHVMEFSTDVATKPVVVKDKENNVKSLPVTPTDGTIIGEKVPIGGNAPASTPATP